ncbi:putative membrane protein [hydrothermal vent metagenome]|uniref:Putative membrane protein n=1 Tax=hydrothermal vent metagenome TaxID=652676 RepID=A0A1W1C6Q0_9ZZZZ
MSRLKKTLLIVGLGLLLGSANLLAQSSVVDIVKKAYDYLDHQDKYVFDAVNIDHVGKDTIKHQVTVEVDRPDKLRIDVRGDVRNRTTYLNNGVYTIYDYDKKMYVNIKVPNSIDGALDKLYEKYRVVIPLAQLLYKNMGKRMKKNFKSKNFGVVDLNGEKCNYIAFSDRYKEVHVWISASNKPLIKHIVVKDKVKRNNTYKEATIVWRDAKSISSSDFIFKKPNNSIEVFLDK